MSFQKQITNHIHGLNLTDKKILTYLEEHISSIPNSTISYIAKRLYVSPNAIVRFAKKIGYSGFSEMKYAINLQLEADNKTVTTESRDYNQFGIKIMKDINKTLDINREGYFEEFIKNIIAENKIVFIALGMSNYVARSFIYRLQVLNKVCLLSNDRDNALTLAKNLENDFLVIFISLSGDTDVVIECANYFRTKKAKILSITGVSNNYLQEVSDVALYVPYKKTLIDGSDMSSRFYIDFLLELMIQEIYTRYGYQE